MFETDVDTNMDILAVIEALKSTIDSFNSNFNTNIQYVHDMLENTLLVADNGILIFSVNPYYNPMVGVLPRSAMDILDDVNKSINGAIDFNNELLLNQLIETLKTFSLDLGYINHGSRIKSLYLSTTHPTLENINITFYFNKESIFSRELNKALNFTKPMGLLS